MIERVLIKLAGELGARPIGTEANDQAAACLERLALDLGAEALSLPVACRRWRTGPSWLEIGTRRIELWPSPFSRPFDGEAELAGASSIEALAAGRWQDKIVVLSGALSREPYMPKDFPFYYPDEHKRVIQALEAARPLAILAATGRHPMSGVDPFPLFEDGRFSIPSAALRAADAPVLAAGGPRVRVRIDSDHAAASSRQLVIRRGGPSPRRIVVCAHMDTKYGTPGALDNAAGVAVLFGLLERWPRERGAIDFVPFNGEEYFGVSGQLAYLRKLEEEGTEVSLAVNIDGVGHRGASAAVSLYNFSDEAAVTFHEKRKGRARMVEGPPWYAGDHSMFAFRGVPCVAVTSSDLEGAMMEVTHTERDAVDRVDVGLLGEVAGFLADAIGL